MLGSYRPRNTGTLPTHHKQEGGRSMAKQLAYDADARSALNRGVDKVADAVRITIGPKGRNVVLDKTFGSPTITNDGVTIAKESELEYGSGNMGGQAVKGGA